MRQFQALMYFLTFSFLSYKAFANCQEYIIHGRVENRDNRIVMLINPRSRSETLVHFPSFMESTLRNETGSRVQIQVPAEQSHHYFYRVYYHPGKVKYYPFSLENKDSIKPKNDEKFSCE